MDGGAWWATIYGIAKSQRWLSNFTFTIPSLAGGKETPHPSPPTPTLVSSITWTKKVLLKPFMDNPAYLSTTLLAYSLSTSNEMSVSRLVLFMITRMQGEGEKHPCYVLQNVDSMMCVLCLVTQLCPTLCDPTDYSPPDSSVHGVSLGKKAGVGCYARLPRIFPTQG